ncbi:MAG: glutaredoxin domain-containing protein [Desulfobacterales bacterium]
MLNVYCATGCPHCQKAVKYIKENNIEMNYIDIEKEPEDVVQKVIDANGGDDWVVPTLEFNGKWRRGKVFDAEGLKADLQKLGAIPSP